MYRPVQAIEVRVWDQRVGAVALDPASGFYAFEYDPRFARAGFDLAPLKMSVAQTRGPFVFPDLPELTFKRLPALLADALPDRFGNALVDAYMQREGVRPSDITVLDRLAYMGKRAFGALEFRPSRGPRDGRAHTALELSALVEEARKAVAGEVGGDPAAEAALRNLIRVGTSAGGARAKAAIAWNPESEQVRAGQFDVPPGFQHWLLKFDGVGVDAELGESKHYGRIEYAYSLLAGLAGIDMSECRLLEENGRAHFMTRRFDRNANEKHHLQSLCALAHLDYNQRATHDYSQLIMCLDALGLADARIQAFRRIAFNVMARNHDDHTKNISFRLARGGSWSLAPAYDLTHAYNPRGQWTHQHLMSVNGKFSDIRRDDLMAFADRFDIPGPASILEQVSAALDSWPECAAKANLPTDEAARVRGDFVRL